MSGRAERLWLAGFAVAIALFCGLFGLWGAVGGGGLVGAASGLIVAGAFVLLVVGQDYLMYHRWWRSLDGESRRHYRPWLVWEILFPVRR